MENYPTLMTPDGPQTIMNERHIAEILERYISKEFSDYILDRIEEVDGEKLYAEQRIHTDLENYEASLDNYHTMLEDIQDALEEVTSHIEDSKRINKEKIYSRLIKLQEDINEEL